MRVLSFDPGVTTGWCLQDENGIIDAGQAVGFSELDKVLERHPKPDVMIIEDYVILPSKAKSHSGSRVEPVKIIGLLEHHAFRNDVKVIRYPARMKPIQQKHSGVKPTGAHKNNHWVDAYNHGWWFLFNRKLVKSKLQMEKSK